MSILLLMEMSIKVIMARLTTIAQCMVMVMVYLKPNVQGAELDIDGLLVGGDDGVGQ